MIILRKQYSVLTKMGKNVIKNGGVQKAIENAPKPVAVHTGNLGVKGFSDREPVSDEDMKKAEESGVVQRKPNGKWGIIAKQKKLWWAADYSSKEKAKNSLMHYEAEKHSK